ncbi:hypothetical protein TVAG_254800 [Trichomonas vaginalis G3]|uniref:Uncharacterized protein n=1 Tax=Trichomonas vaginalis (strain ATCC PRA-98 / G3) TaxID=412133 RepID=A2EXM2_TRIV3|nr:hypothetical protein TVAGG3_0751550 [Trichomonas vaginalis G3]EAY02579.1 hypothetical protein TVAG_254800 [Trichomonas vaginalis G3]KAI5512579.1 hypothetical protein TVAGG3_0751550 [Trichomonas vaginalis G3]|eukprot:XP_001314802.1 hypothetical protein [Trichomonas vaginalis G3]
MATDLRNSKNFFESVRPVKYSERSLEMTVAEKSIFDKVSTIDFKTPPQIQFMCKNMSTLYQATDFNQNERLRFLCEKYDVNVKPGRFIAHFGILLGLLCAQWLGEAIEIIPRCFCSDYWFDVSQTIQEYENWQHILVIIKLINNIKIETPQQQDLFDSLQLKRYLASGRPPFPGSTPRLILTAFLARAVSSSPVQLSQCDDLKIYFKFRKNCGFTTHENTIESIHHEFFCTFSIPNGPIPEEGDKVSIAHPLSGEWTEGTTISVNNGRIFVQLGDLISQMPILALFWDGRGLWKEGTITKRIDENINKQIEVQHNTFEVPDMNDSKVAPSSRTTYLDIGREALRKSKFIDRSFKKNVTFRGIVDPPFKRPNTARRRKDPAITSPHQIVDDVVNVVKGTEISEGRYLRKFLVKFVNELTKKSSYVWVSEADIPKCDVDRLIQIYMKHLGN